MKLSFHGGFYEVGRSCIEVGTKDSKILLDAGIKIGETGGDYPQLKKVNDVDAVAVSHAHLDHIGALPFYNYNGLGCQIFCTKMTKTLSKIMLKDSYHVELLEHVHPAYHEENIFAALDLMKTVHYRETYHVNDAEITLFDAGHIPGSSSVLVEAEGKRLLYSGDINTDETHLMYPADTDYGPIDILICEATYGDKNHPSRAEEEARFLSDIRHTLANNGSVIISAFAIGRAQEMLLILGKGKLTAPIWLDGMARRVLARLLEQPKCVRNLEALSQISRRVKFVKGQKNRSQVLQNQGIFVSPSGMLDGGPVIEYLKKFWHDEKSCIMLTSFQGEGTNGRLLLEQRELYLDGAKVKACCGVQKYDFSSHIGMTSLHKYIKKVNPKHVILNHGDPKAIEALGHWAKKEGYDVRMPKNGDSVVL